jgi:flagellar basal-body rod protein FlgF
MYSELYTSVSGMMTRMHKMDMLTNNLANSDTVGFKLDELISEESPIPGHGLSPSQVKGVMPWIDFSSGPLKRTEQPLDLALDGDGFFVVRTPKGERLTRDGRFSLGPEGTLRLGSWPVLMSDGGEVILQNNPVEIREDGRIYQGGVEVGRLWVATVSDMQQLRKEGEGLFRAPDNVALEDQPDPSVRQGYLEGSNGDPIKMMAQMIDLVRSFEMHQRAIQTMDQLTDRSIQRLGRVA